MAEKGYTEIRLLNNNEARGTAARAGRFYQPWHFTMPETQAVFLPKFLDPNSPICLAARASRKQNGTVMLDVCLFNQDYPLRYEQISRGIAMNEADKVIRKNFRPSLPEI